MVNIAQCRAARGLLGWTQQELADAAGLSKTAINNFEKGHSDMKAESLKAIRTAFEARDIEFLGAGGVRMREDRAEILKGPGALPLLLDDIAQTLKATGNLLVVAPRHGQDWQQSRPQLDQYLAGFPKEKTRILCEADDVSLWKEYGRCRVIAPHHEASMISFTYGQKTAFLLWQTKAVVMIGAPAASQAERERFEFLWGAAQEADSAKIQTRA